MEQNIENYFNGLGVPLETKFEDNYMITDREEYLYSEVLFVVERTSGKRFVAKRISKTNPDVQNQFDIALILSKVDIGEGKGRYRPFLKPERFFDDRDTDSIIVLTSEMCGDTLEKKIQEGTFKGEADDPKKAAQELIWALSLMRKENIVHSNIKPSNVVFSTQNHAYLIDYGGSYRVGEEPIESTDIYNSPEMCCYLTNEELADHVDCATDIWSLGLTIVEMVHGEGGDLSPYDGVKSEFFRTMSNPSKQFLDLIGRMLEYDSIKRQDYCAYLIDHPWFSSVENFTMDESRSNQFHSEIDKLQGTDSRPGAAVYVVFKFLQSRQKEEGSVGSPPSLHSPKVIWGETLEDIIKWIKKVVFSKNVYTGVIIAPVDDSRAAYFISEEDAKTKGNDIIPMDTPAHDIKTLVVFY